MLDMGIIRQVNSGMYSLLPLGLRVLQKLEALVDSEMTKAGAQKMLLPILTSATLWNRSGRLKTIGSELFTVEDRHKKLYVLNPTYEEAICELLAGIIPITSKDLPLKLYQISRKWRDEMKPRLGLLRGREFVMKDLYTFDTNLENAQNTYNKICESYDSLFKQIGVDYVKVIGAAGIIGGSLSHEYHYLSDIGEDTVLLCQSCGYSVNSEVLNLSSCLKCNNNLSSHSAIEVGHTFLLDTKYSKPLNATFLDGPKPKPLVMGCFGLGLTRIIAAVVEILSTNEVLRWPNNLAPFNVCILTPKKGSKEEIAAPYAEQIFGILNELNVDTIIDDRIHLTIGRRMFDANRTGYPFIIVIGKTASNQNPMFEIHDVKNSTRIDTNIEGIINYFNNQDINREIKQNEAVV
ncbi:probable proline--tRNA ligase, mitochondrial isoform X2 [Cephus cinctus]|nr:probable proline--tRNA ligase, mitochondrial isoform X2 [Cephus cinctus]XP_024944463.1 probable proline--tRNA ligase, mitochondrial isoform X2 [Cephus cinctus]